MEALVAYLITKGGISGLVIIGAVLLLGVMLRQKGILSIGDSTKVVASDGLSKIDEKLGQIHGQLGKVDRRLTAVEHDLEGRPTRKEFHDLELSLERISGKFDTLQSTTNGIRASQQRMEDHMYSVSEKLAGGKRT